MTSHDLINLLIGVVLPMLVALVTHAKASSRIKSGVLLVASVLTSVLSTVTDFTWKEFARTFVQQFGAAVVAHFGVLSPAGLTGSSGVIQQLTPSGLGAPSTAVAPTPAGTVEGDAAP